MIVHDDNLHLVCHDHFTSVIYPATLTQSRTVAAILPLSAPVRPLLSRLPDLALPAPSAHVLGLQWRWVFGLFCFAAKLHVRLDTTGFNTHVTFWGLLEHNVKDITEIALFLGHNGFFSVLKMITVAAHLGLSPVCCRLARCRAHALSGVVELMGRAVMHFR